MLVICCHKIANSKMQMVKIGVLAMLFAIQLANCIHKSLHSVNLGVYHLIESLWRSEKRKITETEQNFAERKTWTIYNFFFTETTKVIKVKCKRERERERERQVDTNRERQRDREWKFWNQKHTERRLNPWCFKAICIRCHPGFDSQSRQKQQKYKYINSGEKSHGGPP